MYPHPPIHLPSLEHSLATSCVLCNAQGTPPWILKHGGPGTFCWIGYSFYFKTKRQAFFQHLKKILCIMIFFVLWMIFSGGNISSNTNKTNFTCHMWPITWHMWHITCHIGWFAKNKKSIKKKRKKPLIYQKKAFVFQYYQ